MWDIDMLKSRIIIIEGDIDDNLAYQVVRDMLSLFDKNPREKIYVLIDSNGGRVTSAMAIYDVMNHLSCEIVTVALKHSSSIATLLLAAGSKGKRYAFKNSEIRIGFNLYSDENGINNMLEDNSNRTGLIIDKVLNCYVKTTGIDKEKLAVLCNVNNILSNENVIKSNLVDEIIESYIGDDLAKKIKDKNYYEKIIAQLNT